jgi:hypothetical protein
VAAKKASFGLSAGPWLLDIRSERLKASDLDIGRNRSSKKVEASPERSIRKTTQPDPPEATTTRRRTGKYQTIMSGLSLADC